MHKTMELTQVANMPRLSWLRTAVEFKSNSSFGVAGGPLKNKKK